MQFKALRAIQAGDSCHVQLRPALHLTFGCTRRHSMEQLSSEIISRISRKPRNSRTRAVGHFIAAAAPEEHPTTATSADAAVESLLQRPTLVLAGFLLEELPHIRLNLDAAGGHDIVIVVCHPDLLLQPVEDALAVGEPAWDQPMPPQWVDGGGWGRRRVILFSGIGNIEQSGILQVLQESGIDGICAIELMKDDIGKKLGVVLARAVATPSVVDENIGFVPSTGALPKIEIVKDEDPLIDNFEAEQPLKEGERETELGPVSDALYETGSSKAPEQQQQIADLDMIDRLAASLSSAKYSKD